ncbi:uncharacterized protein LOC124355382 isoform X2 [Homalodisca vitripennis]|uniref:uncharacterized protein LOC124355382 isoform X2 n=1 Tax=Homalodisca vitripennis TaxID=197043 RepID=UPI001EEA9616|nr:uncharacterized protein LOC124355382 isoform X2 [Homalodisca vitripennis]
MGSSNSVLGTPLDDVYKQEVGMESLPVEVLEMITERLTPQELSACCAVSVDWRDAFNQDSLWRPHCNKDTAEYLETAECRVEPRFESPESEDSTLSPVCRWRMCYMREIHLRNNWRQWNFVRDEITTHENVQVAMYAFVSRDYLITSSGQQFLLWDIRGVPVLVGSPFSVLFQGNSYFCDMISDNAVVVVKTYTVEVYKFESVLDENWPLEYFFFVDGTESHSSKEGHDLMATEHEHGRLFNVYIVTCGFFVGFTTKHSFVFHVWDLHKGGKLKRVGCPVVLDGREVYCSLVASEKQSTDFVVVVRYSQTRGYKIKFYIYSLTQLKYLPFEVTHDFPKRNFKCVLHEQYLVVPDETFINVYNYVTSTRIATVSTEGCDILSVGGNILITEKYKLHAMFNTENLRIEPLRVTNTNRVPLVTTFGKCISDRFFYTIDNHVEVQLWEVGKNSESHKRYVDAFF